MLNMSRPLYQHRHLTQDKMNKFEPTEAIGSISHGPVLSRQFLKYLKLTDTANSD